jgi:hypothetical protein
VSQIGPNPPAAAVAGTQLQAKAATREQAKDATRARDTRAAILKTSEPLAVDNDKADDNLLDQDLPEQGQATYGPPMPRRPSDTDADTSGDAPPDRPQIDIKA